MVVSGVSIGVFKKYRVQLWLGWVLNVVGMGVLSILRPDSPLSHQVGLPILMALGAGTIYAATYFPVLAPLPVKENAHALALFAFLRSFAAVSLKLRPSHVDTSDMMCRSGVLLSEPRCCRMS